ncbi:GNAT family N-acetyltransferase [Sphingobacterium suaedae]|uniref:GNAT family N-acetyltransferase n=1 Tax=Sphingobacterium suaedae TaxID=1686402 RepID=A0ABW5KJ26_9SPHI
MDILVYRDAQRADLADIVAIYNTTISSRMVTADTEEVTLDSRIAWFEEHTADKRPLWVVENHTGEIIGWVSFQSFYGRPAYNGTVEVSIYLTPSARGLGLGKRVLAHAINLAPSFGIKILLAYIFAHNIPSLSLFHRFGFEEWGHFPSIAEMDNQTYSLKILGRKVS